METFFIDCLEKISIHDFADMYLQPLQNKGTEDDFGIFKNLLTQIWEFSKGLKEENLINDILDNLNEIQDLSFSFYDKIDIFDRPKFRKNNEILKVKNEFIDNIVKNKLLNLSDAIIFVNSLFEFKFDIIKNYATKF